jgi:hypothetical protein
MTTEFNDTTDNLWSTILFEKLIFAQLGQQIISFIDFEAQCRARTSPTYNHTSQAHNMATCIFKIHFSTEDGCLLGCYAAQSDTQRSTIRSVLLPWSERWLRCWGSKHLWNVGQHLPDYTEHRPTRQPPHTHRTETLKSHHFNIIPRPVRSYHKRSLPF